MGAAGAVNALPAPVTCCPTDVDGAALAGEDEEVGITGTWCDVEAVVVTVEGIGAAWWVEPHPLNTVVSSAPPTIAVFPPCPT